MSAPPRMNRQLQGLCFRAELDGVLCSELQGLSPRLSAAYRNGTSLGARKPFHIDLRGAIPTHLTHHLSCVFPPPDAPTRSRTSITLQREEGLSRFTETMYGSARSSSRGLVTGEPSCPIWRTWARGARARAPDRNVVVLKPGMIPKTPSGKLRRAHTLALVG